jgi:hypothetical protein
MQIKIHLANGGTFWYLVVVLLYLIFRVTAPPRGSFHVDNALRPHAAHPERARQTKGDLSWHTAVSTESTGPLVQVTSARSCPSNSVIQEIRTQEVQ